MSNILAPFQLLELNIISAQDLANVSRSMRTYAVAWVHPDRKLSTRVDTHGDNNPTWNDKFVFRVDEEFLHSDTSAVMIEIYGLHWFRDVHVGTVRVLVGNLIPTPPRPHQPNHHPKIGMRFVALQVRRPSGRPQGILNIGVAVLDSSMRSMPLYTQLNLSGAVGYRHLMGEDESFMQGSHTTLTSKPEFRRSKSDTSSMIGSELRTSQFRGTTTRKGKASSMVNESSSEIDHKKKGQSKASSLLSGSMMLRRVKSKKAKKTRSVVSASDAGDRDRDRDSHNNKKGKNGKASSLVSGSEISVDPPRKSKAGRASSVLSTSEVSTDVEAQPPIKVINGKKNGKPSSLVNGNGNGNGSDAGDPPPKKVVLNENPVIEESDVNWSESEVERIPTPPPPKSKGTKLEKTTSFQIDPVIQNPPPRKSTGTTPLHPRATNVNSSSTPKHARANATPIYPRTSATPPVHSKSFGKFTGLTEYGTPRKFSEYGTPKKFIPPAILTESELGPSASEVAAEVARAPRVEEEGSSIVGGWSLAEESVEGLQSKLERWRTELPPVYDRGEFSSIRGSTEPRGHARRHTDGGNGLFSCFSNICGCQCHIVCGGNSARVDKKGGTSARIPRSSSTDNVGYT